MNWASTYVGIPYADRGRFLSGCDCWGLARLVYRRELGIKLPSYVGDYISSTERAEIDDLIGAAEVTERWRLVEQPAPFDLILLRRGRLRSHIGSRLMPGACCTWMRVIRPGLLTLPAPVGWRGFVVRIAMLAEEMANEKSR